MRMRILQKDRVLGLVLLDNKTCKNGDHEGCLGESSRLFFVSKEQ